MWAVLDRGMTLGKVFSAAEAIPSLGCLQTELPAAEPTRPPWKGNGVVPHRVCPTHHRYSLNTCEMNGRVRSRLRLRAQWDSPQVCYWNCYTLTFEMVRGILMLTFMGSLIHKYSLRFTVC